MGRSGSRLRVVATVALGVALVGGCGDDETGTTAAGSSSSSTTSPTSTNITTTITAGTTTAATGTTAGSGTTTAGTSSGSSGGSSTTDGSGSGDSTGGGNMFVISWCRLQFPPSVAVAPGEAFEVYARVFSAGLTDMTTGNDLDPALVSEFGYGPDGTNPDGNNMWTWSPGSDNPGWNGNAVGEPNNDEYLTNLTIPTAGTWDYAARFSGNGGTSWVYCDLDDLINGYSPDQAGDAVVQ